MAEDVITKEQAEKIVAIVAAAMEKDSKLTRRQACEDILEIIGIPTHTREEVCRNV